MLIDAYTNADLDLTALLVADAAAANRLSTVLLPGDAWIYDNACTLPLQLADDLCRCRRNKLLDFPVKRRSCCHICN